MSISFFLKNSLPSQDEINMSNRNALMVLRFLGWDGEQYCGEIATPADLIKRCDEAIATISTMPELDPEVPDVEIHTPNGARMVDCGLPAGYLIAKITSLRALAVLAQEQNTTLVWA